MNQEFIEQQSKMGGVMVGRVSNNQDPEKLGRIKLQLPVIDEEAETDWCRIATMMSGSGRGSYFLPEVGDEVLVAFHLGDISHPYVIGFLWNKNEKPVDDAYSEENDIRKITTRKGHEIIFDDNKDDGKITLHTKGGQTIILDEKEDNISIKDSAGKQSITVDGKGSSVEIKSAGQGNATIKVEKGGVKIDAAKNLDISAMDINLQAKGGLNIKSNSMMKIETSAMLTLKGSMTKIN